eukprot:CAMPEP_0198131852 /NCGR_PEP_ID=MMETSP1442-20131203/57078_1 /TAXON_ID= /ORGANISM="Craspedostauros australis, Strain CCMP3328" /LENGTH=275 /DNA_ID=CAMNT_0043792735 /DNA_START=102 /DNA_END=929 /DNA_ORIENTATION=+
MKTAFACTILSGFATFVALAASPITNLSVTLRGKKYEIPDGVATVQELQERLSDVSGVDPKQQGRVLFSGKSLSKSDVLSDVGVQDGDQLNLVPSSKKKSSGKSKSKSTTAAAAPASGTDALMDQMKEKLAESGIDTSKLDEMVEQMGGGAGGAGLSESMEQMSTLMKSPMFQEMMNDPERLEQSRQMILSNPMLKSMMGSMPGMEELLNDPVAWREAMQAAAKMYENMDSNDLMQSMMGGAGDAGASGIPPGLFDGMSPDTSSTLALNELDEDD